MRTCRECFLRHRTAARFPWAPFRAHRETILLVPYLVPQERNPRPLDPALACPKHRKPKQVPAPIASSNEWLDPDPEVDSAQAGSGQVGFAVLKGGGGDAKKKRTRGTG